jgi:hypothetical protein
MQATFVAWYGLCHKRKALKGRTPAMASGLANEFWSIRELLEKRLRSIARCSEASMSTARQFQLRQLLKGIERQITATESLIVHDRNREEIQ